MGSIRWPRGHGLAKSGLMAGRTVRRPGQRPITPQVAWTSRTAPSRKSRSNFLRVALARGETELDNMRATNMQAHRIERANIRRYTGDPVKRARRAGVGGHGVGSPKSFFAVADAEEED